MEFSAITHYMEKRFCYAIEPGKFVVRIETKKDDMEKVILHYRDKYIPLQYLDTSASKEMEKVTSSRFHDYYEVVIDINCICLRYQFELIGKDGSRAYYGVNRRSRFRGQNQIHHQLWRICFPAGQ